LSLKIPGGSKLRGDLKWPPPEYKEAAARENEERRQLALGPVCRPRRINRVGKEILNLKMIQILTHLFT